MKCRIKLFSKHVENNKTTCLVFKVIDPNNHETFIIVNLNTENEKRNFKNELIGEFLYAHVHDDKSISWLEIDNMIARINRAGVVIV